MPPSTVTGPVSGRSGRCDRQRLGLTARTTAPPSRRRGRCCLRGPLPRCGVDPDGRGMVRGGSSHLVPALSRLTWPGCQTRPPGTVPSSTRTTRRGTHDDAAAPRRAADHRRRPGPRVPRHVGHAAWGGFAGAYPGHVAWCRPSWPGSGGGGGVPVVRLSADSGEAPASGWGKGLGFGDRAVVGQPSPLGAVARQRHPTGHSQDGMRVKPGRAVPIRGRRWSRACGCRGTRRAGSRRGRARPGWRCTRPGW